MTKQKACDLVKQAIDADIKQDWQEAFKLYKNSLDFFNLAYKCAFVHSLARLRARADSIHDDR